MDQAEIWLDRSLADPPPAAGKISSLTLFACLCYVTDKTPGSFARLAERLMVCFGMVALVGHEIVDARQPHPGVSPRDSLDMDLLVTLRNHCIGIGAHILVELQAHGGYEKIGLTGSEASHALVEAVHEIESLHRSRNGAEPKEVAIACRGQIIWELLASLWKKLPILSASIAEELGFLEDRNDDRRRMRVASVIPSLFEVPTYHIG